MGVSMRRTSMLAVCLLWIGCGGPVDPQEGLQDTPEMRIVSGDHQASLLGGSLGEELVVEVVDAAGSPILNMSIPVTWTVDPASGTLESADATTDGKGLAHARWTLSPELGTKTLQVQAENTTPVTFTAKRIAEPGPILFSSDRGLPFSFVSLPTPEQFPTPRSCRTS